MTAIPARRRRRKIAAMVTSGLSVLAVPSGLFIGTNSLLHASGGNSVDEVATLDIPNTAVEMLAVRNSRNEITAIALLAVAPEGKGGTIVSVPVGSSADVASTEAPRRIADSFVTGGLAALRTDVENLLNITVDFADDVTASELAIAMSSIGAQSVVLSKPVIDSALNEKATVVLPAGSSTVLPEVIAAAFASSEQGIPESTRLPQVKQLWGAVAQGGIAISDVTGTAPTNSVTPLDIQSLNSTISFFTALLAGEIDVWQFSTSLFTDAQRNPNNADLYGLNSAEVLMVMASVVPSALTVTSTNIAVMVDVPFANSDTAQEAVTRLAFLGANVVLVREPPEPAVERTIVYYNDSIALTEAENYESLLGPLEFIESRDVISGVNLRIVLGNDFVAFLGQGSSTSASTTSTTEQK
jgi:hypothetical protein